MLTTHIHSRARANSYFRPMGLKKGGSEKRKVFKEYLKELTEVA